MRAFIICPVRNQTEQEQELISKFIKDLEDQGVLVHWPYRDTDQTDDHGFFICLENQYAIQMADIIYVYWNPESNGSLFDLGMAFMANKPLILINPDSILPTEHKSFNNVLLKLDNKTRESMRNVYTGS